jgi:transposase
MEHEALVPGLTSDALPLHGYYRVLGYLSNAKPTIEKQLHARLKHLFNQDVSLVFYDLTSSYFEGGCCEMAKHGYSRDHRPDCVQIQIGLLVDAQGVPIAHEVFEGNIKETTTVVGVLDRLKTTFDVKRCIFVSDDGMASAANLKDVATRGYEYITSLQLGNSILANRLLRLLPKRSDFTQLEDNMWIHVLPKEADARYIASYNVARARAVRPKRHARMRDCIEQLRALGEPPEPGRAQRDPQKTLAKADALLRRKGCEHYFRLALDSEGKLAFRFNTDGMRKARQREGMMILTTNSATLTDEEVARGYRTLWQAENAFRHIKDVVAIRPIRHWKDPRVKGHVFICVLAYTLERLLDIRMKEAGLAITARAALRELRTITVANLQIEGQTLRRRSDITTRQRQILKAAGVDNVPEIW